MTRSASAPGTDQRLVEVGAVERGQERHREDAGGAAPRPAAAARTTWGSPWTVRKSRSKRPRPRTAASTVAAMSKSLRSRKTRLPLRP